MQGELFGEPQKRSRLRSRIGLDLVRARISRIERRIERTGGWEADWGALKTAEIRLARAEREASERWKRSFRK